MGDKDAGGAENSDRQRQRHERSARRPSCCAPDRGGRCGGDRGACGIGELGAGGEALLGVFGQRAFEHRVEGGGQAGPALAGARRVVLEVGVDRRHLGVARERHLTGEALEEHTAQRVQIGAAVGPLTTDALGRHVVDRADQLVAGRGPADGRDVLGQPEIGEIDLLGRALHRDQRIARLDVAVQQPMRMRRIERLRQLTDQGDRPLGGQRPVLAQQRRQIGAPHVAHRDEEMPVDLAGLIDRDDPGVIDRRRQPRLRQEPCAKPCVLREMPGQQLERHVATQPHVQRPIDDAHPAAAQKRLQAVTPQLRPDTGNRHGQSDISFWSAPA